VKKRRPVRNRIIEYDLRFFLAVCRWAENKMEQGTPLLERCPFKGLELPKEPSPKRPQLSQTEYTALYAAAERLGGPFPLFLTLAHDTGHRGNAIRQLRWSDVDFERGRILWRATADKTEFEHQTPLMKAAVERLKAVQAVERRIGDAWLFPSSDEPGEPVSRQIVIDWWTKLEKAARIEHVDRRGWHSLRRKFANDAKRTGMHSVDIAAQGGWRGTDTLDSVYMQPDEHNMRTLLERMERLRASGE
jgi:integrase